MRNMLPPCREYEKELVQSMVDTVMDYQIRLYQMEQIADGEDEELLARFKLRFNEWHRENDKLLSYFYHVSGPAADRALGSIKLALQHMEPGKNDAVLALVKHDVMR